MQVIIFRRVAQSRVKVGLTMKSERKCQFDEISNLLGKYTKFSIKNMFSIIQVRIPLDQYSTTFSLVANKVLQEPQHSVFVSKLYQCSFIVDLCAFNLVKWVNYKPRPLRQMVISKLLLAAVGPAQGYWRFSAKLLPSLFNLNQSNSILVFLQNGISMFSLCGWFKSKKPEFDPNNKHYDQVQKTFSSDQQVMLELIYKDLASRNQQNLLTYQNFLLFFGLTGLWGSKLFRQFDEDGRKLITKQQFLYGISQTAKAPHSKKIKLLFNFFKDDEDNGIKFIDFTKMLYNYSRDQLKQILLQDIATIPQLNRKISRQATYSDQPSTMGSLVLSPLPLLSSSLKSSISYKPKKVIEVNYQEPNNQNENESCFRKNYAKFNQYKDPGTILQIKINDFTYIVNYCNMITLVKEFATNIYKKYNINIKNGIFTFVQFDEWIRLHPKLFQSYFQGFHIDIWSYSEGEPNFLSKFDKIIQANMLFENKLNRVYGILIGDMLIIADNYKYRRSPTKVVCLDGLTMKEVRDQNGFGIQLSHRDEYYTKFSLYFDNKIQQQKNLELFQVYEGDTLHDLYNAHEVIGTGKFSIVYRCTQKETSKSFALKDISIQKMTSQAIATMDNESEIMRVLSHPQIIKYKQTIRSKSHIYIIAEYIYGKDLYEYVHKRKKLSQYLSAFIIGKIIEATIYLHSVGIIHRDLKPQNIMVMLDQNTKRMNSNSSCNSVDQNMPENIKLIDFGLAIHQYQLEKNNSKCLAGTPNYIAPEVILDNKVSFKSDNFSIGSILYYLLCGKLAFAYKDMQQTLIRTVRGQYNILDGVWHKISDQAKDLISRLLEPDPQQRIGLQEALNHKWFDIVTKSKEPQRKSQVSEFKIQLMCLQGEEIKTSSNDIKLSSVTQVNVEELMKDQIKKQRAKRGRT